MARGDTQGSANVFFCKTTSLKQGLEDFPKIELFQKVGEKYEVVDTVGYVSGFITKLEKVDKTTEQYGRMRGYKLEIEDTDCSEKYVFDLLYSGPSREILNRLASLESFEEKIKIAFYRSNGFAGGSVKKIDLMGEHKVEIKYGYKEHLEKRIKKVMLNGKEQKDYEQVDNFFDELLEKVLYNFRKAVFSSPKVSVTPTKETPSDPIVGNEGGGNEDEDWKNDLPFRFNNKPLKF